MTKLRSRKKDPTYDCGFSDAQFDNPLPRVPIKSMILVVLLFFVGSFLLGYGGLTVIGYLDVHPDKLMPMIILGSLMFVPGAYYSRRVFCVIRRVPGYTYDDIPDFE